MRPARLLTYKMYVRFDMAPCCHMEVATSRASSLGGGGCASAIRCMSAALFPRLFVRVVSVGEDEVDASTASVLFSALLFLLLAIAFENTQGSRAGDFEVAFWWLSYREN